MRLLKLHLIAFGPFTDKKLDFGVGDQRLVLLHGPNEAGKSTVLRAISDLRFGIPQHSLDNFVHGYPDMRIGGEFLDRNGKVLSLLRRKGRQDTLRLANFDPVGAPVDQPASLEIEQLLTGGLSKDAYEAMFGIDHSRLREGGQALLNGEGEIGATLFEASAGIRSIPDVLVRLEDSARQFFMPGTRGKKARINEALETYRVRQAEFKQMSVRPTVWTEVQKKHQAAVDTLTELENKRTELHRKLHQTKELRVVTPIIATHDSATELLNELTSITLISVDAPERRAAAESSILDASENAARAAAEIERHQQRMQQLESDAPIFSIAPVIKRLAAAAETIDQHRRDIGAAGIEVEAEYTQRGLLAAKISASLKTEAVVDAVPAKTERTAIEQCLRNVETAEQGLLQHRESVRQEAMVVTPSPVVLPPAQAREAIRHALAEANRNDPHLRRLVQLPADIKAAQRAVVQALKRLDLSTEAAFRQVQPLLAAQIDTNLRAEEGYATRRNDLRSRIQAMTAKLSDVSAQREQLVSRGIAVTWDDIAAARLHREKGWALVRGTYIDETKPAIQEFAGDKLLSGAYEDAVKDADRLVDALASDTDRAAQLQVSNREIDLLKEDLTARSRELEQIEHEEHARRIEFEATLARANLPRLSPSALREWQSGLTTVQEAIEKYQSQVDELEQLKDIEQSLSKRLQAAVVATGLASLNENEALSTLLITAQELDQTIKQRETAIHRAAGEQEAREQQSQQRAQRDAELDAIARKANEALKSILARLLLAKNSTVQMARTRMIEFDELVEVCARLRTAQIAKQRAEQALAELTSSARPIWTSLGDTEPADLRLYIENMAARLATAERIEAERTLIQQALDQENKNQRDHEVTQARHQATLTALCVAAGVESAHTLPAAEEHSRRKREAQATVDRTPQLLVSASRRSIAELRVLLSDLDATRLEFDEASYSDQLTQIEVTLAEARQREEACRRELEAIDGSDVAAAARSAMEQAAASVRSNMSPWIRSKIAYALLEEALRRFRDRAQGPILKAASGYFERMTRGEFVKLLGDDSGKDTVLVAERRTSSRIRVEAMSEGTRDQLYLALRLAALDMRREAGVDLPVIFDDVLMTSDEDRSGAMLEALADFSRANQVMVFTHHRHIADVARKHVPEQTLRLVSI